MFGVPNVMELYQHPYLDSLTLLLESHHIHNVLPLVPGKNNYGVVYFDHDMHSPI